MCEEKEMSVLGQLNEFFGQLEKERLEYIGQYAEVEDADL